MNKRQYVFIILLCILFYLSATIIQHEYKQYTINKYTTEQSSIIAEIQRYLDEANTIIDYKKSKAFKSKTLKSEQWYKMKGETVFVFTKEETYNKFSTQTPLTSTNITSVNSEESITKTMTNFQKWVYFFMKKDLR